MLKIAFKYWFLEAALCLSQTMALVEVTPSSCPLHLPLHDLFHLCSPQWPALAVLQPAGNTCTDGKYAKSRDLVSPLSTTIPQQKI